MTKPERKPAGLSLEARKALIATDRAGDLVLIEKFWRTSYNLGAPRFRQKTINTLIARGLLWRTGERLARITELGRSEAFASLEILREAAADAIETRRFKAAHRHKPRVFAGRSGTSTMPTSKRLPYADN